MTVGTDALAEAARLEAAAFYSRPVGDTSVASRQDRRRTDEELLREALERAAFHRWMGAA